MIIPLRVPEIHAKLCVSTALWTRQGRAVTEDNMDYFRDVNRHNVVVSPHCAPHGHGFIEMTWSVLGGTTYAERVAFAKGLARNHDLVWIRTTTNGGRFRIWRHDGFFVAK